MSIGCMIILILPIANPICISLPSANPTCYHDINCDTHIKAVKEQPRYADPYRIWGSLPNRLPIMYEMQFHIRYANSYPIHDANHLMYEIETPFGPIPWKNEYQYWIYLNPNYTVCCLFFPFINSIIACNSPLTSFWCLYLFVFPHFNLISILHSVFTSCYEYTYCF